MPIFNQQESAMVEGKFFILNQPRAVVLTEVAPLCRKDGSRVMAGKTPMFKMSFKDAQTGEIGEEVSTALASALNRINDQVEPNLTVINVTCVESSNPAFPGFTAEVVTGKKEVQPFA